jgi:hypothetical protein
MFRGGDFVLWNEYEVMRPCPTLEQVLERFTNHQLAMGALDLAEDVVAIPLNEYLAHRIVE